MIGHTLSHYRVTALLGAGGMGEVYRATDAKLDREVAIKLLPEAFASDPERLARFEREAPLLASLNHPNIAHVYGFESATLPDGSSGHFLAMELVPGQDLAERLKHGPIPSMKPSPSRSRSRRHSRRRTRRASSTATSSPPTVKLTPDGKVKVLDFGLAKAHEGDTATGSSAELSHSPTLAHTGSQAGLILGTAGYMSPEQARGKAVDKRADVWAFGVVLYEMLTGRQPFGGETVSDVLAAVLTREPDLAALPATTPPSVVRLLRRCLVRDPKNRLRDIGDARLALGDLDVASERDEAARLAIAPASPRTRALPWIAAAVGVGLGLFAVLRGPGPPVRRPRRPPRASRCCRSRRGRSTASRPSRRTARRSSSA